MNAAAQNKQKAQDSDAPIELGEEYVEYARSGGSVSSADGDKRSITQRVLLYIPNRVVDFLDIFRVDVGAGPSVGGVIRVTKYAQAGMRTNFGANWTCWS